MDFRLTDGDQNFWWILFVYCRIQKRNDFVHGQMEVVFQWIPMTWAATAHLATLVEPFPSTDDLHWDFFHIAYPVLDGWLLFYGFSPMVAVVVVRNLRKIPARPVMRNRWLLIAKGGNSKEEDTLMMIRWPTVFEHYPKSQELCQFKSFIERGMESSRETKTWWIWP